MDCSKAWIQPKYFGGPAELKNTILGSEMIGNPNIKTKMFEFEERVLIGWLANTVREPANQDAYIRVQHFCFMLRLPIISDPSSA